MTMSLVYHLSSAIHAGILITILLFIYLLFQCKAKHIPTAPHGRLNPGSPNTIVKYVSQKCCSFIMSKSSPLLCLTIEDRGLEAGILITILLFIYLLFQCKAIVPCAQSNEM